MELLWIVGFIIVWIVVSRIFKHSRNYDNLDSAIKGLKDFHVDYREIGNDLMSAIAVDTNSRKVALVENAKQSVLTRVVSYKDLISVEIITDGNTVTSTKRGSQAAGVLVGGAVLGGLGAVIGGLSGATVSNKKVSKIDLRIVVNDPRHPTHTVNFFSRKDEDREDPLVVKSLEGVSTWQARIAVLIKQADQNSQDNVPLPNQTATLSVADELAKLAVLRDSGVLSAEEFRLQKSKLLGS